MSKKNDKYWKKWEAEQAALPLFQRDSQWWMWHVLPTALVVVFVVLFIYAVFA